MYKLWKLFLILGYLMKQVYNCRFLMDQDEIYQTEQYRAFLVIAKQENIGFGFWMRYQPYQLIQKLNERKYLAAIDDDRQTIQQVGQFIYSFTAKISKKKVLIIFQELNQNDQSIVDKAFINFKNSKQTISFNFEMIGYEGRRILFYFFCNQLEGKTTFGFFQPNKSLIAKQVINDLLDLENIMIYQSRGFQY